MPAQVFNVLVTDAAQCKAIVNTEGIELHPVPKTPS